MANAAKLSAYKQKLHKKQMNIAALLFMFLILVAFWRLFAGEWDIPFARVISFLNPFLEEAYINYPEALIIRIVRLPRFLAALGTGGLLAISGVILQSLLTNPLAEPYTLGIAAGAAFGGSLGFLLGSAVVTPMAFAGAIGALGFVSYISYQSGGGSTSIVLTGIIANAILSAGVTFLKAIADERLSAIVLWLMGSFSGASPLAALSIWAAALALLIPAFFCAQQLDAVSLSEGQGILLGINEKKLRTLLLLATSFATATAVSFFGIIGFVGLAVPHLMRRLIGPSTKSLLLFSFLSGGLLLSIADGAAQRLGELPVGVITALIGGPFFCWILVGNKHKI